MTDVADPVAPAAVEADPAAAEPFVPDLLADVYEAASECNKCSLCQAVCPTYVVNPVEWETARGRVALVRDAIEGRLELSDIADGPLSTCLTCNNCVAACAPRVPTGEIVARARQELHAQSGHPAGQTFAFRSILARTGSLRLLHGLSRAAQLTGLHALARRAGFTRWLGTAGMLMEQVGPLPRRDAYRRARDVDPPPPDARRGRIGLLMCCYQNLAQPGATAAALRVLSANGFEVVTPRLACHGLPARTLGDRDAMLDMARGTLERIERLDGEVDAWVGDVASCTAHVQRFGALLGDDRQVGPLATRVARRTHLASDFLASAGATAPLGRLRWDVAIDEPCSLPTDGESRTAARRLLERIPGIRIHPLAEAAMCCGGAGAYMAQQPERGEAILTRKLANVAASGAEVLVTENISCLVQLRAGARRHLPGLRVAHVFEVLDASMEVARRLAAVQSQG